MSSLATRRTCKSNNPPNGTTPPRDDLYHPLLHSIGRRPHPLHCQTAERSSIARMRPSSPIMASYCLGTWHQGHQCHKRACFGSGSLEEKKGISPNLPMSFFSGIDCVSVPPECIWFLWHLSDEHLSKRAISEGDEDSPSSQRRGTSFRFPSAPFFARRPTSVFHIFFSKTRSVAIPHNTHTTREFGPC